MKKRLDYKWVIIVLCFVMVLTTLGLCSSNKSLFLVPITKALGIDRGAYAIGDSCRFIAMVIVNMFFASLVKKFGAKKLIIAGFLSIAASSALYAYGTSLIAIYAAGALLGIGLSWTTTTMVGWIIGKWCKKNKGAIMGGVLAANGVGGAVAAQILSPIINAETFGYKNAYLIMTGVLLVVCLLMIIFFRDKKDDLEETDTNTKGSDSGFEFKDIKKMPQFYIFIACIFFLGILFQGTCSVAVPHWKDVNFDDAFIAGVAGFGTLMMTVSKFFTGFLYDKKGLRISTIFCNLAAIIAIPMLISSNPSAVGKIVVVVYALIVQFALPIETVLVPIFISDMFGDKCYAKLLGIVVSVDSMGAALGTTVANYVNDLTGTYVPMFIASLILMVVITITLQIIISQLHKKRKALEQAI